MLNSAGAKSYSELKMITKPKKSKKFVQIWGKSSKMCSKADPILEFRKFRMRICEFFFSNMRMFVTEKFGRNHLIYPKNVAKS